jgi:hypothetical protein
MRRWEDNIGRDLEEVGCKVVNRIYLSQDRGIWRAVVKMMMNLRIL